MDWFANWILKKLMIVSIRSFCTRSWAGWALVASG